MRREILRFQYDVVGLPDLSYAEYVEQPNPLAPAFSTLMRPGETGDALRKAIIQRQQVIMEQNEARRALLLTFIERSLPLNEEQTAAYQRLISQQEYQSVRTIITPYEERGIERGRLMEKRDILLSLLESRFGAEESRRLAPQIESITKGDELDALLKRAFNATSIESLGLAQ